MYISHGMSDLVARLHQVPGDRSHGNHLMPPEDPLTMALNAGLYEGPSTMINRPSRPYNKFYSRPLVWLHYKQKVLSSHTWIVSRTQH